MNVKEQLFVLQDLSYKEFYSKLCPNNNNIIGVRIPVLRNLAKNLYKNDRNIVNKIEDEYYEEIMLKGILIAISKEEIQVKLNYISQFVPKIDNWSVCDTFCNSLKIVSEEESVYWDFLKKYYNSESEFELRFLLVMLLNHYLKECYLDLICDIIKNITSVDYYVKMAKAWLLSIMYLKFPKYTLRNLDKINLDDWTYNKTIQKIIESKRVNDSIKSKLRKMKK